MEGGLPLSGINQTGEKGADCLIYQKRGWEKPEVLFTQTTWKNSFGISPAGMGTYQQHIASIMEQSTEFNLEANLSDYLRELNTNRIISVEEQDELFDHLSCEIEALRDTGLSTEESFLISRKRLGEPTVLSSEYQKAKPWTRTVQFVVSAVVFVLGLKAIFNMMTITSLSVTGLLTQVPIIDMEVFKTWGDIVLQISCLVVCLFGMTILVRKVVTDRGIFTWLFPVIFLASEGVKLAITTYSASVIGLGPELFGSSMMHSGLITLGLTILGAIGTAWWLFKTRRLRVEFG